MTSETIARPLVVVGVDGSQESDRALAWAEGYVERSGGTLDIVCAWKYPTPYGTSAVVPEGYDPSVDAEHVVEKAAAGLHLPADRVRTQSSRVPLPSSSRRGPVTPTCS